MITTILLLQVLSSYAQHDFDSLYDCNDDFRKSIERFSEEYNLFSENEAIQMSLTSDFKNLVKRKYHDDYQPATLEFYFNDTVKVSRQVKIKPRGGIRRKICSNPPIKINFKKNENYVPHLRDFDKVKFVDVCRNSDINEQYLISEYLAYKLYNQLTEFSFRVRLLNVAYIDTSGKYKPRRHFAFIIEDMEQLARRLDANRYRKERISPKSTDQEVTGLMDVFQYMIGNTDYYIPMEHNIHMIKLNDATKPRPIVIPYDFDYSGFVNASYATPNEMVPIESVTERYYMGNCQTKERYQEIIEIFRVKKDAIFREVDNTPHLTERTQKYIIRYLNQFYKLVENPESFTNILLNNCQN